MAASDNLGPMFHGTLHSFNVGDVIAPSRTAHGYGDRTAYATTRLDIAQGNARKRQGEGSVYTVEPVDADEAKWSEDKAVITSKLGFRVTGKHNGT